MYARFEVFENPKYHEKYDADAHLGILRSKDFAKHFKGRALERGWAWHGFAGVAHVLSLEKTLARAR